MNSTMTMSVREGLLYTSTGKRVFIIAESLQKWEKDVPRQIFAEVEIWDEADEKLLEERPLVFTAEKDGQWYYECLDFPYSVSKDGFETVAAEEIRKAIEWARETCEAGLEA